MHNAFRSLSYVLTAGLLLSGCQWQRAAKLARQQQITVQPEVLEVHGNGAPAEVTVTVPSDLLHTGYTYGVELTYRIPGKESKTVLAKPQFVLGDFTYVNKKPTASRTLVIPWKPEQPQGELYARGVLTEGRKRAKYLKAVPIAKGMITTMKLAQPVEPLSYLPSLGADTSSVQSYVFYFDGNSARIKGYEGGAAGPLADFLAEGNELKHVTITAWQSPDLLEAGNTEIAKDRAEALKGFVLRQLDKSTYGEDGQQQLPFTIKPVLRDMTLLKEALRQSPMPEEKRAPVQALLSSDASFESKAKQLEKLPSFEYVRNYLFPSTRKAVVQVKYQKPQKLKYEIALLADRIAKGTVDADKLSALELSYAAELTPLLQEKEKLYLSAIEHHQRGQDLFNLSVVYLELAAKQGTEQAKQKYYNLAIQRLREASTRFPTAQLYYNLATVFHLKQDIESAAAYYDLAGRLGGSPELLKRIMTAKATLHLQAGEYDKVEPALEYAGESYQASITRGLLALHEERYPDAEAAFTQAAGQRSKAGLPYYLLAITGARSGNQKLLYANLYDAAHKDKSFVPKAVEDLEFRKYNQTAEFRQALK